MSKNITIMAQQVIIKNIIVTEEELRNTQTIIDKFEKAPIIDASNIEFLTMTETDSGKTFHL